MRRIKRIIAALIAAVFILSSLASCDRGSAAGKYYIKSVNGVPFEDVILPLIAENGLTLGQFLQECGISSLDEYYTIELLEDGTATRRYPEMEPRPGTWKQTDFPPPVGKIANTSFPSRAAEIISSCIGRKLSYPQ